MKVLAANQSILWERPSSTRVFDQEIQCPLEHPVQALLVVLLIRLSDSRQWPLSGLNLLRTLLRALDSHRSRIFEQRFSLVVRLALLSSYDKLIIPSLLSMCTVDANVASGGQPLLLLALPFDICGGALLVVKVSCERKGLALIETSLIEEEGFLE